MPELILDTRTAGRHELDLPEDRLLVHHPLPRVTPIPAARLEGAVRRAVQSPVDCLPLAQLAAGKKTATLIVDDWARPAATRFIIAPILLDLLNEYGIADEDITVVMARGLGLSPGAEDVETAFGPALLGRIANLSLSSFHPDRLAFLGYSSRGTPMWIDQSVVVSDLAIGIGTTFPSPWGGWSGGAKIVVPGVAGAETIRQNHSLMTNVTMGSTDSPGMLDREEIASESGLDLLINLVVNLEGEIVALAAGEVGQTHRRIIQTYRDHYQMELAQNPDIVVTTLDRFQGYSMVNLYPFVDGCLPAVELIAAPGATVIGIGGCPQGVGTGMAEYMRASYTAEDLASLVPQGGSLAFVSVMLGARFARYRASYSMMMVSEGLSAAECQGIGLVKKNSLQEAVDCAIATQGERASVAILPGLGNIILPKLTSSTRTDASAATASELAA